MPVAVRNARDSATDRRWMESVYREYLEDLSPSSTGLFPALGEVGHATTDQLGRWFGDRNIWPLVILHGEQTAGFAIVGRGTPQTGRAAVDYRMAEFFIARSCRRLGVGRDAVPIILDRFAGRWEIVELQSNAASVNFWRKVVARYTAGRYEERVNNGEVRQVFESGARRATPPR